LQDDIEADIDTGITASVVKFGFDRNNDMWRHVNPKIASVIGTYSGYCSRYSRMPAQRQSETQGAAMRIHSSLYVSIMFRLPYDEAEDEDGWEFWAALCKTSRWPSIISPSLLRLLKASITASIIPRRMQAKNSQSLQYVFDSATPV